MIDIKLPVKLAVTKLRPWIILLLFGGALHDKAFAQISSDQQVIVGVRTDGAISVHTADLDGDGDADVLSANDDKIAWYENLGGGLFGPQQVITTQVVLSLIHI